MNREIKFRVWDSTQKKIWYIGSTNGYEYYTVQLEFNKGWRAFRNRYSYGSSENPEDKLMQFTGLKDKNGKDIYEGDILEFNHSNISQYKGRLIYTIKYFEDIGSFCLFRDNGDWWHITKDYLLSGQIIGNIFETPAY